MPRGCTACISGCWETNHGQLKNLEFCFSNNDKWIIMRNINRNMKWATLLGLRDEAQMEKGRGFTPITIKWKRL